MSRVGTLLGALEGGGSGALGGLVGVKGGGVSWLLGVGALGRSGGHWVGGKAV